MRPLETALLALSLLLVGLGCAPAPGEVPLDVPHGYLDRLELNYDEHLYGFGPFIGYYFAPADPRDLVRLRFLCFNERGFYASDAPRNALLFEGEAVLTRLPPADAELLGDPNDRIRPVFFPDAPESWLATRPQPREQFVHFHSCYDARGPALVGYWLHHVATRSFTYDMGGRVRPGSPLYHAVSPGLDLAFAHAVEFDRGPGRFP